jgi:hypothetical protein
MQTPAKLSKLRASAAVSAHLAPLEISEAIAIESKILLPIARMSATRRVGIAVACRMGSRRDPRIDRGQREEICMQSSQLMRAALAVAAVIASAVSAEAALKKYDLTVRNQTNSSNVNPNPNIAVPTVSQEFSTALIDGSGGPNPVLRKFVRAPNATITTTVPGLALQIFTSNDFREGPGVKQQIYGQPVPAFTGTGSTASTIRWGTVTGWTITGSFWCHSNPAIICTLAMGMDQDTVDPRNNSSSYDLGTWSFHGTGFNGAPFISSVFTSDVGNTTMWVRGFEKRDGTVPALPLAGVALLGGSLVAGGIAALRRRSA